MPLAEFEPTISAGERPQTQALDRAAPGFDIMKTTALVKSIYCLYGVNQTTGYSGYIVT